MDKTKEMEIRDKLGKDISNDKKFTEILKILEMATYIIDILNVLLL